MPHRVEVDEYSLLQVKALVFSKYFFNIKSTEKFTPVK